MNDHGSGLVAEDLSTFWLIALLVWITILLAVPLRSYAQPAVIMMSIPFGIVGAVIGHMIMGYSLSVMSMFGVVALSGVVINGALVLIELGALLLGIAGISIISPPPRPQKGHWILPGAWMHMDSLLIRDLFARHPNVRLEPGCWLSVAAWFDDEVTKTANVVLT